MKVIVLPNNLYTGPTNEDRLNRTVIRWQAVLFITAMCAVFSGVIGLVLSGLTQLGLSDNLRGVGHLGTWLVAAFFPLLILAAHALDKVQAGKKVLRLNKCRKQGLKVEDC